MISKGSNGKRLTDLNTHNCLHMQSSSIPCFPWGSPFAFVYALVYILVDCILYSGKLLRGENFHELHGFVVICESKIWGHGVLWHSKNEWSAKVFHCENRIFTNLWKFSPSKVFCYMVVYWHTGLMSGGVAHSYGTVFHSRPVAKWHTLWANLVTLMTSYWLFLYMETINNQWTTPP